MSLKSEDAGDYLARMGNYLRDIWSEEYRRYHLNKGLDRIFYGNVQADGGVDPGGRRHTRKWSEYARILMANGLDMRMAVSSLFGLSNNQPPSPNILVSRPFIERCKAIVKSLPIEVKNSLPIQTNIFKSKVFDRKPTYANTDESAQISVLCDPSVDLSPLFRYCAAKALNLDAVSQLWEGAATEQYLMATEAYDAHWKFIPVEFANSAKSLRAAAANWTKQLE